MENKCISALEYIRANRKASLDEVYNLFGTDGSFVFHMFQARYSSVRKQKDGRKLNDKREEVIDGIIEEFSSQNRLSKKHGQHIWLKVSINFQLFKF